MEFLKRYLVLIIALFSINSFATGSAYVAPESCTEIINTGKKIAEDNLAGFSAGNTMQDFINCNLEILPNSLSTEIMYSLFGDNIFTPLSHVNSFITSIYTNSNAVIPPVDVITLQQALENKVHTFPVLIATIEATSFAAFQLISAMLGIFSLFYLVNTMSEGTYLGSKINTFWTFAKMSVILGLLFPLDGLGLNVVQLFILFVAFCGSLLASLLWSILPLFKYAYLTDFVSIDDSLKIAKDETTIEIAESLVKSSLCDISARQALLLKGTAATDFTEEILSQKDMYTCLTTTNSMSDVENSSSSTDLPFENRKTIKCAASSGVEHEVDCGGMLYNPKHNEELKEKFKEVIYPFSREMAIKSIRSNCTINKHLEKGDSSNYYTYCADVDNISFTTEYKNNLILTQYSGDEYSADDYEEDIKQLKEMIESALTENLSEEIMENPDMEDKMIEKLAFALNKGWFNSGTFLFDVGSSTNVKNDEYKEVMLTINFRKPIPKYYLSNAVESLAESYNVGDAKSVFKEKRKAIFETFIAPGDIHSFASSQSVVDIFLMNEDLESIGLTKPYNGYKPKNSDSDKIIPEREYKGYFEYAREYKKTLGDSTTAETSWLNELLFPTLILGKKFNEPDVGASGTCSEDYMNCQKMPLNPIATIIDSSRKAVAQTGAVLMVVNLSNFGMKKYDAYAQKMDSYGASPTKMSNSLTINIFKMASMTLDFLAMFLSLNLIISILGGYILPIVIFIYFVGNALSWIITLVFTVLGAPLWLGLHLMPSKEDGFAGHAKKGYTMIMDVFLKPAFIVLGVFGAFVLSTIMVVIFNVTFEIVMSTFDFFDAPESAIELFYNFLLNMIYIGFLLLIFFKSAKAVYKIPNSLENWIGLLSYEEAGMWKEVTKLIEKTFLSGIKKYLILA